MENNELLTNFTEDEYKEFYSWLFNKNDVIIEKEIDITKGLECKNPYTYYTPEINAFFKTKAMKRLGKISQLANAIINNPSAVHTRLQHCIGAYQKMLDFYMLQYRKEDWKVKNSDETSRLKVLADIMDMASHDIGHNVLSHTLEGLIGSQKGAHEVLGDRIIHENPEVVKTLKNIHPDLLKYLDIVKSEEYNLHTLKEGKIDFDRADYLVRDSIYLGVEDGFYIDDSQSNESLLNILNNIMNGCEIYTVNIKGKDIEVPIFSFEVEPEIEKFLQKRFENYKNIYTSKENMTNNVMLRKFCIELMKNDEDIALEFKEFINHISKNEINDIDLDEFLNWNDTKLYNQIFDVIENTKNNNLRNFAIDCMPNLESLVSIIYERQMPYINPKIDENGNEINIENEFETDEEKEFYLRVKSIVNDEFKYADKIKNHNRSDNYISVTFNSEENKDKFLQRLRDGVVLKNGDELKLDEETIQSFENWRCKIKKYDNKEPIFIKGKDGKIYTFDEYPDRKLDITPKDCYGITVVFNKMRLEGLDEEKISMAEKLKSVVKPVEIKKSSTRLLSELKDIEYGLEEVC